MCEVKGMSVWGMDTGGGVVHREVRSGVRQGAFLASELLPADP